MRSIYWVVNIRRGSGAILPMNQSGCSIIRSLANEIFLRPQFFSSTTKIEKRLTDKGVEYMASNGAIICDSYLFPEIDESLQYLFHASGLNTTGSGLKFFLLNPKNKKFDLETV